MLVMYDEPFAGLDPIALARHRPAHPQAERCARRHLDRGLARRGGVAADRRLPLLHLGGQDRGRGHARRDPRLAGCPSCTSSCTARSTARCRSTTRRAPTPWTWASPTGGAQCLSACAGPLARPGPQLHRRRLARGLDGALLRARARLLGHELQALPAGDARGLLQRRALAHHHRRLGTVRRHGAGAAGLRDAAEIRRDRVDRRAGGAVARARARARGGRRCSSPRAPARRSPRRSAS